MISALLFCAMASTELTFATYNIRYGTADDGVNRWELRRGMVFDTIREIDADVLGVQEALAYQIDEILVNVPGYAYVGVGRDDGKRAGELSAILYRKRKLTVAGSRTFWLSDTPEVVASKSWGNGIPRICTWARFSTEGGDEIEVYNTHFDHQSQPSREKSADLIFSKVSEGAPTVVMGDFNAGEDNPAFKRFLVYGIFDTFRFLHPDAESVGTFTGFDPSNTDGEKIDHVICSQEWEILSSQIVRKRFDGRVPSDHEPVVARLRLR